MTQLVQLNLRRTQIRSFSQLPGSIVAMLLVPVLSWRVACITILDSFGHVHSLVTQAASERQATSDPYSMSRRILVKAMRTRVFYFYLASRNVRTHSLAPWRDGTGRHDRDDDDDDVNDKPRTYSGRPGSTRVP